MLTYANGKILVSGIAGQDFGLTRINGAGGVGIPGQISRPGGLLGQVPHHPQSPSLFQFQPGFLLNLVERIDQASAQPRTGNPTNLQALTSRFSTTTSRTNSTSRSEPINVDDFFAELGDDLLKSRKR